MRILYSGQVKNQLRISLGMTNLMLAMYPLNQLPVTSSSSDQRAIVIE